MGVSFIVMKYLSLITSTCMSSRRKEVQISEILVVAKFLLAYFSGHQNGKSYGARQKESSDSDCSENFRHHNGISPTKHYHHGGEFQYNACWYSNAFAALLSLLKISFWYVLNTLLK